MGYRLLTPTILALHFAFLGFVVLGGFLAWRWPGGGGRTWLAASWGFLVIALSLNCPLTWAENWSRERSGQPPLTEGFIDRYITGVLYPARFTTAVQVLVALVVLGSWVGVALRWRAAHP